MDQHDANYGANATELSGNQRNEIAASEIQNYFKGGFKTILKVIQILRFHLSGRERKVEHISINIPTKYSI